jgi:hypothetical protein
MDLKMPGMLNAAIKDCPVFGGKVKSFDAAAIAGKPGVKKVLQVGDSAVAVVADTWWRAKSALEALPIEWDKGPNAKLSSAEHRRDAEGRLDAADAAVGNQNGDARAAIAASRRKIEAVYSYPYQNHATMEPMNATARWTPERCEVWTPTQNGEAALAAAVRSGRTEGRAVRGLQAAPGRRLRPARHERLGRAGGPHRERDAGRAGQADLDARRRHDARPLPSGHAVQADGGAWTSRATSPRCTCASPASLSWPAIAPQSIKDGKDPVVFQGTRSIRSRAGSRDRLQFPEPAGRPRDAQSAGAAGLLARREPEPEHDLPRVLHRRDRPRDEAGPAGAAPQADGRPSEAPGRAERGGRARRLGQAGAEGRVPRPGADHGLRQLRGRLRRGVGEQGGRS